MNEMFERGEELTTFTGEGHTVAEKPSNRELDFLVDFVALHSHGRVLIQHDSPLLDHEGESTSVADDGSRQ